MRRVRMIISIPGVYDHGQPWPPACGELDIADNDQARDLILGGYAVDAAAPPARPPAPPVTVPLPPLPEPEPAAVPEPEPAAVKAPVPEPEPEPEPEPVPEPEPAAPPAPADPKSAWIDYAISQDPKLTQDKAAAMTKVDLMSKYGGRL